MNPNEPQTAPQDRATAPHTSLNAVFRRLSDAPSAAAVQLRPETPPPPAPPAAETKPIAASPAAIPTSPTKEAPPAEDAAAASQAEAVQEPAAIDARVSFAVAVLARAGAAIAARSSTEPGPPAGPPSVPEPSATAAPPATEPAEVPTVEPPASREAVESIAAAIPDGHAHASVEAAGSATAPSEREPDPRQAKTEPVPPRHRVARLTQPMAWPVPTWLVAPVLTVAIPDSPFGFGRRRDAASDEAPAPPATVGFVEPEAAPTTAIAPPVDAHAEEIAGPPRETEAPEPRETEPPRPREAAGSPGADAAEVLLAGSIDAFDEAFGETAPRVEAKVDAVEARPAESLAAARRRDIAGEAPISTEQPGAGASPGPPSRPSREARPSAPQQRAESPFAEWPRAQRPLGAPQAARRAGAEVAPGPAAAAGLAEHEVPALVEPEPHPQESTPGDIAVAQRPGEGAMMRNRRLYRRTALEADIEIDGVAATLVDLSMGGFGAAHGPSLEPGAVVPVTVRLALDGVEISTRMRARMLYTAPRTGGRFVELTASQTALLRYLVTWRGQSVGALGTMSLLEAISGPAQRSLPAVELPAPEPEAQGPWWTRWFGWLRARAQ